MKAQGHIKKVIYNTSVQFFGRIQSQKDGQKFVQITL